MKQLDDYTAIDHVQNAACDVCGSTGTMVGLWTHHNRHSTPAATVCPADFLSMDGRFRNQEPEAVFAKFQDKSHAELHDGRIEVHATSPFGDYNHVHYTEPAICPVKPEKERPNAVVACIELTGESEMFNSDGEAIGTYAAFVDVATRVVLEENHQASDA